MVPPPQLLDGVGPVRAPSGNREYSVSIIPDSGRSSHALAARGRGASLRVASRRRPFRRCPAARRRRVDRITLGTLARRARTGWSSRPNDNADARLADLAALTAAAHNATRSPTLPPISRSSLRNRPGPRGPSLDRRGLARVPPCIPRRVSNGTSACPECRRRQLPSDMALTSKEGLEEERRLFYVAVTRPRRYLHVYVPLRYHYRSRGRDDDHTMGQPSRFLSDDWPGVFDAVHVSRHAPDPPSRSMPDRVEMETHALLELGVRQRVGAPLHERGALLSCPAATLRRRCDDRCRQCSIFSSLGGSLRDRYRRRRIDYAGSVHDDREIEAVIAVLRGGRSPCASEEKRARFEQRVAGALRQAPRRDVQLRIVGAVSLGRNSRAAAGDEIITSAVTFDRHRAHRPGRARPGLRRRRSDTYQRRRERRSRR